VYVLLDDRGGPRQTVPLNLGRPTQEFRKMIIAQANGRGHSIGEVVRKHGLNANMAANGGAGVRSQVTALLRP
jgi:ribosomal protein L13E